MRTVKIVEHPTESDIAEARSRFGPNANIGSLIKGDLFNNNIREDRYGCPRRLWSWFVCEISGEMWPVAYSNRVRIDAIITALSN